MELQGLQEALKVEIQCHQDGELKRQLHDRITALSDKQTLCKNLNELQNGGQKLAVRSIPPLSLMKPPAQSIAISVVPAKTPVSMVTAHMNGQKAASSEPLQTSPINLQTAGRAPSAGILRNPSPAFSRNSQMLGTLTAVPIKVPQVSSLHRLAGQAATLLPQVRPKTQIPDSLPLSPCEEVQPVSLQRAPLPLPLPLSVSAAAVLSPKSHGATLPTANSTFSPERQPNGQSESSPRPAPSHGPDSAGPAQHASAGPAQHASAGPAQHASAGPAQHASAGPGVAYAIIAASPATGNGVSAVSEAVKVIIIQPQAPSSSEADPSPSQEAPPTQKKDEDPEKISFMVALGLVTTEQLEEIQTKRQERKRRSTANPAYSGLFEPERKRLASHYLNSSLYLSARDSEEFCWKEDVGHDVLCSVCQEDGELQFCVSCPRAFHPTCLHPPLRTPPRGAWYCPKCQKKVLNKENLSWPQNFVQSYVTHKTVRQEEKRRLLRRNIDLKKEFVHLEERDEKLNDTLKRCMDVRERLLLQQRDTQASLERLKALIRLIRRDQLIQVAVTTTATIAVTTTATIAAASLLSQSWIKPTSAAAAAAAPGPSATPPQQKSHAHTQEDANI